MATEILILERQCARVLAGAGGKDNHGQSQAFLLVP